MNVRNSIFGFTLLFLFSECRACFSSNQTYEYRLRTGSTFYMECRCDEPSSSRISLVWLDNHGKKLVPSGPGTKSNVYTQWWDEVQYNLYITNISRSTSGVYKCVTHNGGLYFQAFDVQAYDLPYFVNTKKAQYVINGTDALINCEARGAVDPLISWCKESFEPIEIMDDDKYSISGEGLLIRNISNEDNGIYKCVASDLSTGEEVAIDIKVEVVTVPEIVELVAIPENAAYEGASISIECLASGTPPPEYSWQKITNIDYGIEVNFKEVLNKIEFDNITADDRGMYQCIATNSAGSDTKKIELKVLVPPKITQFSDVTAVEDGTVQVVCRAQGIPVPKINILFLGESDDLSIVWDSKAISETDSELYLSFLRVKKSHEGSYICNATNEVDSVTAEMNLTVLYKPYFKTPVENTWGWNGNPVNLTCDPESNPPARIFWRYESTNISTEKVLEINRMIIENGTNVPVLFNNETMYGVYECVAQNDYGEAKKIIVYLEGFAPPTIRNVTLMNITSTSVVFDIEGPEQIIGPPVVGFTSEYDEAKNYNITDIHNNRTWAIDRPYKINKLKPNSSYIIRFAAVNDVGPGPWSESLEFMTLERSTPEEPAWDTNLEYINDEVLKWKVGEDNGEPIDYYVIRYCQVIDLTIQKDKCYEEMMDPTNEFFLNNLDPNTTYYFELVAHNSLGNSTVASTYITLPEKNPGTIKPGAILGIALVVVFICLVLLDLTMLFLKRKGVIASCVYKKKDNKAEVTNARDKKGLLRDSSEGEPRRSTNGHREFEYNKSTGIITGKHSAV
ncbi:unnamed protein product [Leptosia nina]|uniref:Fasciclin-2-like n=1 Tax=Leptosia nina TaxID=320188 RepID=A0AAV1J190_9NEOP